jgi:hypothetical protein
VRFTVSIETAAVVSVMLKPDPCDLSTLPVLVTTTVDGVPPTVRTPGPVRARC